MPTETQVKKLSKKFRNSLKRYIYNYQLHVDSLRSSDTVFKNNACSGKLWVLIKRALAYEKIREKLIDGNDLSVATRFIS